MESMASSHGVLSKRPVFRWSDEIESQKILSQNDLQYTFLRSAVHACNAKSAESDRVPQSITLSGNIDTGKFNHWSFLLTAQNRTREASRGTSGARARLNMISAGTLQKQLHKPAVKKDGTKAR